MDWLGSDIWVTWVAIGVVLGVLELTAGELIFLMLGMAAFMAAGFAAFNVGLEWQLVVFGVTAAFLLSLVRPRFVAKIHDGPSLPTGDQRLVGTTVVVAEPVDHLDGRVRINDILWTARPENVQEHFAAGEQVIIAAIDGATAIIKRKENS
ncbi:MAG: NfeD family protein [Actinomycetales bacterium]|nr:NfeD family protein [Actinomycetales bacterium]